MDELSQQAKNWLSLREQDELSSDNSIGNILKRAMIREFPLQPKSVASATRESAVSAVCIFLFPTIPASIFYLSSFSREHERNSGFV